MNINPARAALIFNSTGVNPNAPPPTASAAASAAASSVSAQPVVAAAAQPAHVPGWDAVMAQKGLTNNNNSNSSNNSGYNSGARPPVSFSAPPVKGVAAYAGVPMLGLPPGSKLSMPPAMGMPPLMGLPPMGLPPMGLPPGHPAARLPSSSAAGAASSSSVAGSTPAAASSSGAGSSPPGARAYVGRIPLDVGNDFLKRLLSLCGTLKEWNRIRDPVTGKDKAFGYAEYLTGESLARALRVLNGFVLFDSELLVKCDAATQLLIDASEDKRRRDFLEAARARDPTLDAAAAERKWKAARVEADDRVELLAHRLFSLLYDRGALPIGADGETSQVFVLDEAEVDSMPIDDVRAKLEELRARHNPKDKHARDAAAAAAATAADARRSGAPSGVGAGAGGGGGGGGGVPLEEVSLNRGAPVEAEVHAERERIDRKRMRELRARDDRRRADHARMLADESARERLERDADRRDAERADARRRAAEQRARAADELKELRRMCDDERDRRQLRHSVRRRAERRAERDDDEAAARREERERRAREAKEAADAKARADAEAAAAAELERFTLKKTDGALSSIPLQLRGAANKRKVASAVFAEAEVTDEEALYQRKKNLRLTRLDDEPSNGGGNGGGSGGGAALTGRAVAWATFDEKVAAGVEALIAASVREFLGADDGEFVSFVAGELRKHCTAEALVRAVAPVLEADADKFVQSVWRVLPLQQ